MAITSIALFFVYLWGFGFAAGKLARVKESESFLERQLTRLGTGLAAIIILAMLLNIVNIPLDWKIFLVLAVAVPAIYLFKNFKNIGKAKLKVKKSDISIAFVLLIFFGSFYMYASGAFAYPYLENDDPWGHAEGTKYIAVEKTFDASPQKAFQYMNPYPPSYNFILGLMHQTNDSLYWTLKFFNALLISLSLVFFYFFAAEFVGNRNKALFATVVLAAVPAYLSHFIWAPALAMTMFFPALYALEKVKHDKKWQWIAAITIGGLIVSHPTHTLTLFAMISVYILVKFVSEKKPTYFIAGFMGAIASLSWWGFHGKEFLGGVVSANKASTAAVVVQSTSIFAKIMNTFLRVFSRWTGTASRPYTFNDFFFAKGQNLINNPVGFGIVVSILTILGVLFVIAKLIKFAKVKTLKKNNYLIITLIWLVFTFLIVNNQTFNLPIGWFAFRTWMILAVPVSLIAAEGLWSLFGVLSLLNIDKKMIPAAKIAIVLVVLGGIWFTSGQQKYEVNTAVWPPGAFWGSPDEVGAYVWLKTLPPDTKVFSFVTDGQVIGMDKFSCGWCEAEAEYRQTGFDDTAEETSAWMKRNSYEYLIMGGMEVNKFGQNITVNKVNGIATSGLFTIAYQTNGAIVFNVI
ncbi:hypothetical protein CMO88_00920 [Candidatus Woesearchaeota archaeon]|nr:hypothetical protein [Candidatus Woesearchaeota archaeon]|tara:strand:+ start:8098 stop:9990 length:1893 start_codon:yes stop_codon:yes gene_type:complete